MHSLEAKSCVPLLGLPPWSAERYTVSSKMSITFIAFIKNTKYWWGTDPVHFLQYNYII